MKYCTQCGNKMNDNHKFCSKCGCKFDDVVNEDSSNNLNEASKTDVCLVTDNLNIDNTDNEEVSYKLSGFQTFTFILFIIEILGRIFLFILFIRYPEILFPHVSLKYLYYGVSLFWIIPITANYYFTIKNGKSIKMGFKIVVILFVSILIGILLLCDEENSAKLQQCDEEYSAKLQQSKKTKVSKSFSGWSEYIKAAEEAEVEDVNLEEDK